MKRIIIAIDGFSGCGKSTTARQVAQQLNYRYIDTGAMYRAVTLFFLDEEINYRDAKAVEAALKHLEITFQTDTNGTSATFLNGKNVEADIRSMRVAGKVSQISAIPEVRKAMVVQQHKMGEKRGLVMDGRDIGTVVFPDAELKIFLTADIKIRAERRQLELRQKGTSVEINEIIKNLEERDLADSTRTESPLKKASDAITIDTSQIGISDQVNRVIELARKHMGS
jgi:cytidylate kinase